MGLLVNGERDKCIKTEVAISRRTMVILKIILYLSTFTQPETNQKFKNKYTKIQTPNAISQA
jgi:hypothetical protein